jgi:1-phosphofructokinase family hexose kinase
MILTVTPNTAVDRVIFVEEFTPGGVMRTTHYVHGGGGKALDASIVLQILGVPNLSLNFLAGANGQQLAAILDAYGVPHDDVWVEGETRLANVIAETRHHRHSHLIIGGLVVRPQHVADLLARYAGHLAECRWVLTGGSLPTDMPVDFFATLVERAQAAGVPALVDAGGPTIHAMLKRTRPAILKMNRAECAATFGLTAPDMPSLAGCAAGLVTRLGLPGLVLTCGRDGLIGLAGGRAYLAQSPPQAEVNAAGAGDGASAAIAYRLAEGDAWPVALRYAAAVSAAVVLTEATAECRPEDIEQILPECTVRELPGVFGEV